MKIIIEIEMDNDAFAEYPEIELRSVLNTIPSKFNRIRMRSADCICAALEADDKLLDINGNTVGRITLEKD